MIAAILCLAVAILAAPSGSTRRRLRSMSSVMPKPSTPSWMSRLRLSPFDLALAGCIPLAVLGTPTAAVAAAVGAATARGRRRRRSASAHRERERRSVLAGLDVVIGELRVGAHPAAACESAAQECDGAAAEAFRSAAARARLGGSAASGLVANGGIVADDLRRIADAWAVAEAHGLALAELLHAARTDLLGRSRFRTRAEAGLAGARATAAVLAGLPALGIGLGQLMGASPVRVLLGGGLGGALLVTGTVLVAVGLLWTDRIVGRVVS
ncbi:type II secretion system F family protein [Rhodococcus sp. AG1013]|uniref:type II secretion system F family protein n=1 Tax=unclassified Rhodococcus (in: high G+C Gram-positive bacteria) TaxID=192944 RepID=UPI000E0B3897|nr:type II secretion system F family protein [Rhodococcus sp. AG1013]